MHGGGVPSLMAPKKIWDPYGTSQKNSNLAKWIKTLMQPVKSNGKFSTHAYDGLSSMCPHMCGPGRLSTWEESSK